MSAKKKSPRLLKSVKQNTTLHLEHMPIPKPKVLTKREQIYKVVTDCCEEHYLLTDSECGLSLIDDTESVTEIEGTDNGYLLKFRMDCGREFALRQLAIRLSKRLNCLRRFFCKEDSVTYPGVSKPLHFLECAMVLEDNRDKEPIDRSGEEDEEDFLFGRKTKGLVKVVEEVKKEERKDAYDGTQTEEEVDEMLEETEVVLTEESYADADEAYANFA